MDCYYENNNKNNVENFLKIGKTSYNLLLEKYVKYSIIGQAHKKGGDILNAIYNEKEKVLTVEITKEIDHHIVEKIRRKIDDEIIRYMPRKVILDFSSVEFMDSAGIGMVLGRYKVIKMIGGSLELVNISPMLKKIFEMSGITRICEVKEVS